MVDVRISREGVEVLALEATARVRISREAVEVIALQPAFTFPPADSIVVTREAVEAIALEPSTLNGLRISREAVEVVALQSGEPSETFGVRISREGVEVVALEPRNLDSLRITREAIEVIALDPIEPPPSERIEAFFWDKKHDGWWIDTHDSTKAPTSTAVFDADEPDDRRVAVGCADGFLRIFDNDAATDDGVPIGSVLLLGPFAAGLPDAEARFSHLQTVFARDQAGVSFRWYVSQEPDVDVTTLTPLATGLLPAGLSPVRYERARGLYVWLMVIGTGAPWAYEAGSVIAEAGGRARIRP